MPSSTVLPHEEMRELRPPELRAALVVQFDSAKHEHTTHLDELAHSLRGAGLVVAAFRGVKEVDGGQDIFLHISAPLPRLLAQAELQGFALRLNSCALRDADISMNNALVAKGVVFSVSGDRPERAADLAIPDHQESCWDAYDPYSFVYAPYVSSPELAHLYSVNKSTGTLLSEAAALKLLIEVVEASTVDGGAGINLDRLVHKKRAKAWFPISDPELRRELAALWLPLCLAPWSQPLMPIRDYFGERIAWYIGYVSYYCFWLPVPALCGIAFFVAQELQGRPSVNYLPVFACFICVWAVLFTEFYKRRQATTAMAWGMTYFLKTEPVRPEFASHSEVHRVRSFVHGKPIYWAHPCRMRVRHCVGGALISTLLGCVIVLVFAIFWIRALLILKDQDHGGSLQVGWPDYITSVINSLEVQIMNYIYSILARSLTDWELHPTLSSYENSLTIKLTLFYVINSYFSLFYIAALKSQGIYIAGQQELCDTGADGSPDCMSELQQQLASLMLTRFAATLAISYAWPPAYRLFRTLVLRVKYRRTPDMIAHIETIERGRSDIERAAQLDTYDTFSDYLDTVILFGYVSMFVVAFPLAPLVALVIAFVTLKLRAPYLIFETQRPRPEGAQDIGAWQLVANFMCHISVASNLAIVAFTNPASFFGRAWSFTDRLIFFIAAEHIVFGLQFVIANYFRGVSPATALQLERSKYLVDKHIFGKQDAPERIDVIEDELARKHKYRGQGVTSTASHAAAKADPGSHLEVASSYYELTGLPPPPGTESIFAFGKAVSTVAPAQPKLEP